MKKFILIVVLIIISGFAISANAVLVDNRDGTITEIRNDGTMLMWLQDAFYARTSGYDSDGWMTWYNAMTWADTLVYAGYDDWRLPTTVDGPYVIGYDGSTTAGWNITTSEMGYLYYEELGNLGLYATDGTLITTGEQGLRNTGPFINLGGGNYWSSTVYSTTPDLAWYFQFSGAQYIAGKGNTAYAWAVRDITPAPEPISTLLFITGGTLLAGRRYLRRKK